MNFLSISGDEKVTSVLAMPKQAKQKDSSLLMVTKNGIAKRVSAESFHDVRRSGLISIKLSGGDELVAARLTEKGDEAILATAKGQSIRFKDSDIREMGRAAAGVHAIKLSKGDSIVGTSIVKKGTNPELLVLSKTGYGKKTKLSEYKVQKRGGSGIKTMKVTPKTGGVIASHVVDGGEEELVVMSQKGQVIRTDLKEIPTLGRQTQGVRIMKLRSGDGIAALICL